MATANGKSEICSLPSANHDGKTANVIEPPPGGGAILVFSYLNFRKILIPGSVCILDFFYIYTFCRFADRFAAANQWYLPFCRGKSKTR